MSFADFVTTRLQIDPEDAAFLAAAITSTAGSNSDAEILLFCDYDGDVSVHNVTCDPAKAKAIRLIRSHYEGQSHLLRTHARLLRDVLVHGCLEIRLGYDHPSAKSDDKNFGWRHVESIVTPLESERPPEPKRVYDSDGTVNRFTPNNCFTHDE